MNRRQQRQSWRGLSTASRFASARREVSEYTVSSFNPRPQRRRPPSLPACELLQSQHPRPLKHLVTPKRWRQPVGDVANDLTAESQKCPAHAEVRFAEVFGQRRSLAHRGFRGHCRRAEVSGLRWLSSIAGSDAGSPAKYFPAQPRRPQPCLCVAMTQLAPGSISPTIQRVRSHAD